VTGSRGRRQGQEAGAGGAGAGGRAEAGGGKEAGTGRLGEGLAALPPPVRKASGFPAQHLLTSREAKPRARS